MQRRIIRGMMEKSQRLKPVKKKERKSISVQSATKQKQKKFQRLVISILKLKIRKIQPVAKQDIQEIRSAKIAIQL